jgi:NDP-sugar pyrophosphorylase family protein
MSKRAVILAGGQGARLKPYTVVLPKPLMPIGEFPILEVIVRQLAKNGFDHVTMAVNHQAELIKAFFNSASKWDLKIDFSKEHKPLSTIGPLRLIPDLPEDFLVMNGDILTDLNFAEFFDFHVQNKNMFTVSSKIREQNIDYGVLESDGEGRLSDFKEKPKHRYEVSMGVYAANRGVLDLIPEDHGYGVNDLLLDLIAARLPVQARRYDGYWLDIGRPDDYAQAIEEFDQMRARFLCE